MSKSWALDPVHRFLLVSCVLHVDMFSLKQAVVAAQKELFGTLGLGMDCDVLSFQEAGKRAIVRCSKDHLHYVWAALTQARAQVLQVASTLVALSHSSELHLEIPTE